MAKVENFEAGAVDEETVFPALQAANFAASVLLQMLIQQRGGHGTWIEEIHENMRNSLDRGAPDAAWQGDPARWRGAQHMALRAIFAHQHMVGSVKPPN